MIRYVTNEMLKVARAMNPRSIQVVGKNFGDHSDTRPSQTTHLAGGTIMGKDRNTSVLNRYLQSWDVHNLFALGSGAFPQGLGYNPTGTVAALAYWAAKAIRTRYLSLSLATVVALMLVVSPVQADEAADQALVKQGEYVARTGDCVACHTARDGKPLAGACRCRRRSAPSTQRTLRQPTTPASATGATTTSSG
jgi:mono/diheme cytochrome c family protein